MTTKTADHSSVDELIEKIATLPMRWHQEGTVPVRVLRAIARHTAGLEIGHSMETGTGKTTLLLSHLSRGHKVFAKDGEDRSLTKVRDAPLLNVDTVKFIEGPTQATLPRYVFDRKLQFALIDGPHGYPFPDLEYYFIYPHLETGGLLLIDDIQIPTIRHLFNFLKEDEMFRLLEVVHNTAFFRRTAAPVFDPEGDGWWLQNYNTRRPQVEPLERKLRRLWGRGNRRARRVVNRLLNR
jgi:hypothetical protein